MLTGTSSHPGSVIDVTYAGTEAPQTLSFVLGFMVLDLIKLQYVRGHQVLAVDVFVVQKLSNKSCFLEKGEVSVSM